jgi:ABC-type multidrug transport system fused ATPase/permease subunit
MNYFSFHLQKTLFGVFSMLKQPNDIILDKALSYTKLITNFLAHLVLSLVIGPIIAFFLYASYFFALSKNVNLNEDKLIGYWFVIIVIIVFGLVWIGFINNRKSDLLSSQKCQRWYYEFWNMLYDNIQDADNIPTLPSEASVHFEVRTISMDKTLPRILGFGILALMAPIMAILSYFSPSILLRIDPEITVTGNEWIAGAFFWSIVFIFCLVLLFYWIRLKYFKPNVDHYLWRQFWINLILVTLMNDKTYSSMKGYEAQEVAKVTQTFSSKYKAIYDAIGSTLANQNQTLNVDQLEWLENMILYFETTPGFLIPPSLTTISKFYTYSLIVAGAFSSIIVEPARYILSTMIKFVFG